MDRLLRVLLGAFIRRGTFRLTTSRGTTFTFGDGTGTPVAVRLTTRATEIGILLHPELKFGEAYMDGTMLIEQGTIADVLAVALGQSAEIPKWARLQWLLRYVGRRLAQFNPRRRARRNVAHHYDLDGRLYSLFLDADRQYSCGYFETPESSLDDAQIAKKRHLAAKLRLDHGQRVLDIGCGWGGLGLYLADFCGGDVTGVTLSREQYATANERASERGLSERARFLLQDYRDVRGVFDRIVSVGMFEHVGVGHYDAFFQKCARLLSEDGVMLLHSIGRSEGPGVTNPWIAKYIFPGGYIPALSEVLPVIERTGLLVTDLEILRLHYAETLKAWRQRFLAHREDVERIYEQRFVRMWEFYLAASEMSFREQNMMVMQVQLTKRQGVVPMTRDYIGREEQRLAAAERNRRPPLRLAGE
ncbi:MAG TPA: cyclopropane-fatty-acyl-phospholipid synthase family protein [Pseudolabrys sp.]|jgi:cyclopropane-fatty-acyl-phospholipid synthase|nr:cyclopropane-fatty-acyl-phospholipid synthase family protein [Pseudolabrys sp.]